jgi:hypothetical protein
MASIDKNLYRLESEALPLVVLNEMARALENPYWTCAGCGRTNPLHGPRCWWCDKVHDEEPIEPGITGRMV